MIVLIIFGGFVYCLWPASDTSHVFHHLVIQIIPSAIVALLAILAAFFFIHLLGLSDDQKLSDIHDAIRDLSERWTNDSETVVVNTSQQMAIAPKQVDQILEDEENWKPSNSNRSSSVFIVVDVQNDFITGSLKIPSKQSKRIIPKLAQAIDTASANGLLVIFTRDWHPDDHWSFKPTGPHEKHCVRGTDGAEIHDNIPIPPNSIMVDFGVAPNTRGYSPFENPALGAILSAPYIETVYVAGIALEYCVQATCFGAKTRYNKQVIAIEELIGDTGDEAKVLEVWERLRKHDVEKWADIPEELKFIKSDSTA